MRIFAAVVLVLLGCASVPVSSSGHMRLQDEMAIMAMVDSIQVFIAQRPVVLDVVHLKETIGVSKERTLYFSDITKRDSLWLADPAQVARCNGDIMPRCLAIEISRFKRRGDIVEMEVLEWPYRGCGYANNTFRVQISSDTARVVHIQARGGGSCGMRSGKPLPPDSSGALHRNRNFGTQSQVR